jgi:hypothetical protein
MYFIYLFIFMWRCDPTRVIASSLLKFLDHTQRRTTVGRTPMDEWPARRRDLYLTTHNTQQQTNIHASGGIQTHDLSRRAGAGLLRLRLRAHWDRHVWLILYWYRNKITFNLGSQQVSRRLSNETGTFSIQLRPQIQGASKFGKIRYKGDKWFAGQK